MSLYSEDPKNPMPEYDAYTVRNCKKEETEKDRLRTFLSGILMIVIPAAVILLLYALYGALLKGRIQ